MQKEAIPRGQGGMPRPRLADVARGALLCRLPNGVRRALRLIGWNAAWLIAGLALVVVAGEIWFRLTVPFARNVHPSQFVPGVGLIRKPLAEMRHTDNTEFWTVSRINSLGFLDREPIDPERAAASCHIAMIGDSFVEGREVSIPDKFHVRLEALAARERPELNVTTSAFGMSDTGQINQLPYYDKFARQRSPKLVVLVFAGTDFRDNAGQGRRPFVTVKETGDGTLTLRPPDPDHSRTGTGGNIDLPFVKRMYRLGMSIPFLKPTTERLMTVARMSYFAQWLDTVSGWMLTARIRRAPPPDVNAASLEFTAFDQEDRFTAFALDRFRKYTLRDGASLAILATHTIRGDLNRLRAMADERDIPVIDQRGYITRKGGRIEDAHWARDIHWNVTGHRYAAEALFEHLALHPEVCDGAVREKSGGTA